MLAQCCLFKQARKQNLVQYTYVFCGLLHGPEIWKILAYFLTLPRNMYITLDKSLNLSVCSPSFEKWGKTSLPHVAIVRIQVHLREQVRCYVKGNYVIAWRDLSAFSQKRREVFAIILKS